MNHEGCEKMCTVLFAYQKHPKYDLIVAANRDEFYERPTAEAHFWGDHPNVLAGRDLEKMGTWMGVTTSGRFSALTNYRDPNEKLSGKLSRGRLVADILIDEIHLKDYLHKIRKTSDSFSGFNLIVGDMNELYYFSNIGNQLLKIDRGIHGVSNHLLNTNWPKVNMGKQKLKEIITKNEEEMIEELLELLRNNKQFPDELLPHTGVSLDWERKLSSLFIESDSYGTRSSTIILMNKTEIRFVERVYSKTGSSEQTYAIKL